MKKLIITLVLALILSLALTACGSNSATTTSTNDTNTASTSANTGAETSAVGTTATVSGTEGVTTTPVTTKNPLATAYNEPEKYVTIDLSTVQVSNAPIKKDVDAYIDQVLSSLAREDYKKQDNTVAAILGDMVNINYKGRAKDPSLTLSDATIAGMDNTSQTGGYDLVLGSGSFIPGFEEQLVGAKTGETVTIDVTFPKGYSDELSEVAVLFDVTINSLSRATVSEKNVLYLTVVYTLKTETTATSDLALFLEGHDVQFDMRDTAAKFDEHFDATALRTAILGKSTFGTATFDVVMPLEVAKEFGHETELSLSAQVTVEQVVFYPDALTDEDVKSYTGGEYTTVDAFVAYITNHYKSTYAYEAISKAAKIEIEESIYSIIYNNYFTMKLESLVGDTSTMTEEELAAAMTDDVKKQCDEFATTNATAEYNDRMLLAYLSNKVGFVLTEELYQEELKAMFDYYMEYYYYYMIMYGISTTQGFEDFFGRDQLEIEFISNQVLPKLADYVTYVD